MTEADARAAVVAEAIAWLGTPYHHRAKLKGVGVDCAQLVLGVYENTNLVAPFDTGDYPPDWHLHRETERYMAIVSRLAGEIAADQVQPGDVILFKFGRAFSHGAIVTAWPQIVHANRRDGAVVLGDVERDGELVGRPMRFFSFWSKSLRALPPFGLLERGAPLSSDPSAEALAEAEALGIGTKNGR